MSTSTLRRKRRSLGGWEVYDGTVHIGWVVPTEAGWNCFVAPAYGITGRQVGWGVYPLSDAVAEVAINRLVWR